ncbi:MAG: aminoacyl-tRNA hydrolase [Chitinivibrionales bacterium]|nr:aminoacyl-tRNA hydrolase [Chitinivibrionales bacterium]
MIRINDQVQIDESDIGWRFIRSPGPGGQHVNTSSTGVQLVFDLAGSQTVPEDMKKRLQRLYPGYINNRGEFCIDSHTHRSQTRNRNEALERLISFIRKASIRKKKRKPSKPTKASREKRLQRKKKRGEKKQLRKPIHPD